MKNKIIYALALIDVLCCIEIGIAIPAVLIWLMIQKSVFWIFALGFYGFIILFFAACFTEGAGK